MPFLMFLLLTFSFLEVCVNSSFETYLMTLCNCSFSLGLSPVVLLTVTHTIGVISPLLSSIESDLARTYSCFMSQRNKESLCLCLSLCMGNKTEFLFVFMIFALSPKGYQFKSLLLGGSKPLFDMLRLLFHYDTVLSLP